MVHRLLRRAVLKGPGPRPGRGGRGFRPLVEVCESRRLLALMLNAPQVSVTENPDQNTVIQFDVTVEPSLEGTIVPYYTTEGPVPGCAPAVDGRDFLGVSQASNTFLIFPANGPTTQTVSIPVVGSYLLKPSVCFTLHVFRADSEESATAIGVINNRNSTVVSNTNATGSGSLFGAIQSSNVTPGPHQITFAIPATGPVTIPIVAPLPALTNPATIDLDATTQPGSAPLPRVVIDGSKAGAGASGLTVLGGNTTIRGLGIGAFSGPGIVLDGAGHDTVDGNFLVGTLSETRVSDQSTAPVRL